MKITIFINEISGGGAERVACNLANHLYKNGNDVKILTLSRTEVTYPLDKSISVSCLVKHPNHKKMVYFYMLFKQLKKYIKQSNAECYIVFLPVATCLLLACRSIIKVPIIASERSAPGYAYSKTMQVLLHILCSRADGYVFQTEDVQLWYKPYLRNTQSVIIPNPINSEFLLDSFSGPKRKCIVTAGRLDRVKNHTLLLQAFKLFSEKHDDYTLEIYGEGNYKDVIENYAINLGIRNKVFLMGNVMNLPACIVSASIFVLSSDYEGMPNALIEGMALGLPCISTDCPVGGPRYLIDNNANGILVPVGDYEALSESMNRIIGDEILANKLGENAKKIRERLDSDSIFREWDYFINSLINRNDNE